MDRTSIARAEWKKKLATGGTFLLIILAVSILGVALWMTNEHQEEVLEYTAGLKIMIFELQARVNQLELQMNQTQYKIGILEDEEVYMQSEVSETATILEYEMDIVQDIADEKLK